MTGFPRLRNNSFSLTEQAYILIRDAICNNDLKPNQILSEDELASEMGISRTPIRAALNRLTHDKLVQQIPGKGMKVSNISREEMEIIFDIRVRLERLVLSLVMKNSDNAEEKLKRLEENINCQKEAFSSGDHNLFLEKDQEFHLLLAEFSKSEFLYDFIRILITYACRGHILIGSYNHRISYTYEEHEAVYQSIMKGDIKEAQEKMQYHLIQGSQDLLKKLQ